MDKQEKIKKISDLKNLILKLENEVIKESFEEKRKNKKLDFDFIKKRFGCNVFYQEYDDIIECNDVDDYDEGSYIFADDVIELVKKLESRIHDLRKKNKDYDTGYYDGYSQGVEDS